MSITLTNKSITTKVATIAVAVALAFGFAFAFTAPSAHAALTESQIQSILSLLQSFGADQSTINNVNSSLRGQATPGSGPTTPAGACTFTRALTIGSTGADVTCLQNYLKSTGNMSATQAATGYFGTITRTAVAAWQAANGVSPTAGYFGSLSQAKYNAVAGSTPPGSIPGTPPPATGTGLQVSNAVQPLNTVVPASAARVPFTNFIVTAGNDGDVVMQGVTVQRTGLSSDIDFAGVVLLDSNGMQLGIAKTLGSTHQAVVGEAITIPRGTSKTFTVAGNMAAVGTINSGEAASFDVVAINAGTAIVSGSLPIRGATHTTNNTLTIGSISDIARGSLDPGNNVTKEVGAKGYTFNSIRITLGSQEEARLRSIRWNQASSTGVSDLANIVTVVDGTTYPTTVSADGKYYTTVFPGGLLIPKGGNRELSVKGDIVSGSGRAASFVVEKNTDVDVVGETYHYGITPSTSDADVSSGNIWFPGYTVTVSGGTLTFSQNTAVASQNIAVNQSNQILAGFKVKAEGEPISVQQMVFDIATTNGTCTAGSLCTITDITIVDENGSVVSGPKDATSIGTGVTLTDTVTFPLGEHIYAVRGKLGPGFPSDATVRLTTNPSSDWSTVKGQNTGNTITPSPSTDQALQTMTAKAAAVTISVSTSPTAQTIVAGGQQFTFANYQLDASASGEDLRFNSLPLQYGTDDTATNLSSCQIYNGATSLNTGSNLVNPSAAASSTVFTFDSGLVVSKGTVVTLTLKCNISSSANSGKVYEWGYDSSASPSATGVSSGQSATITENSSAGSRMTVAGAGTLTVAIDASAPSYAIAAGGQTGVTLNVLKFISSNEAIQLNKIALQLTNAASSSAADLMSVTIWDGATQVGSAVFAGSSNVATSSLTTPVIVPKDGVKILTIKGDVSDIGTSQAATEGHLVAVDYDNDDSTGTSGTGQSSGSAVNRTSSADTSSAGIRVMNTYPTFAKLAVPTNTLSGGQKTLLRWSVTAAAFSPVGIGKFTLTMATTTAIVKSVDIYCFTDSAFSVPCSGLSSDGGFLNTDHNQSTGNFNEWVDSSTQLGFWPETSAAASTTVQVPTASTRYFEVRGTVTANSSGASVSTQLEGDATYPTALGNSTAETGFLDMGYAANVDGDTHNDFIWSPNATTSAGYATERDWTNGYGVIGLPGSNMSAESLSQ